MSLHYILIISSVYNIYCPPGLSDAENTDVKLMRGLWRYHTSIESMYPKEVPARFRDASMSAEQVGETYIDYFMKGQLNGNGTITKVKRLYRILDFRLV